MSDPNSIDYQDGFIDGRFQEQPHDPARGDDYDDGYIDGSAEYLDALTTRNGSW